MEVLKENDAQNALPMSGGSGDADTAAVRHLPGRLAGLTVWRQVVTLAFWPFCEQMLGFAVGFVDTAIAGRLSIAATEAIAAGAYVGWLIGLMFGAVGVGAGALVARAVGARHRRVVNAVVGQAFVLTLMVGAVLAVLLYLLAPTLAGTLNLTEESLTLGIVYLRTLAMAVPALGVMYVHAACLRSAGDTRTPFLTLAIVNAVNVSTSLLFVYGPAPWGGHGVAGIAFGTAAAWIVGAVLMIGILLSRRAVVKLYLHRIRLHLDTMRRIGRISGPQFLDSLAMWSGNFLLATFVGHLGASTQIGALAAHIVVIRIEALSFLPGWALGQAAATLIGQYLGLGDVKRAWQAVLYCWMIAAGLMGSLGILFFLAAPSLVSLVTTKASIVQLAAPLLMICAPAQIFLGTAMVLEQAVRGAGDTRPVALLVAASTYLVRLPAAYLLGIHWGWGVSGIWIALCSENALRGSLIALYFLSGRWQRIRV